MDLGRTGEEGACRSRQHARGETGRVAEGGQGDPGPPDRQGEAGQLLARGAQRRGDGAHPLPGDARAGPAEALPRTQALDHARPPRESQHDPQRPHPAAAGRRRQDTDRHLPRDPPRRLTRPRAVVLVTGSELVRGDRTDLNGPFLAAELLRLGLEPARIVIVGDREEELSDALAEGLQAALCVVSGGLGPTHDDRTVELLSRATGIGLHLDDGLHGEIEGISRRFAGRLGRPYVDFEPGVRKQATIPEGALSLGLAGTAPGLVLESGGAVVVVLPGPPAELRRLWADALRAEPVRRVLDHARPPELRLLRFFGAS